MTSPTPFEEGLRVTVTPDGDGTALVSAHVSANGFTGHGAAWFSEDDIRAFADRLGKYPLATDPLPRIEGGYWSQAGDSLKQVHLGIAVYPINARGQLGCRVVVADPPISDGERSDSQNRAEVELLITYDCLARFAKQLGSFTSGGSTEAFLSASKLA